MFLTLGYFSKGRLQLHIDWENAGSWSPYLLSGQGWESLLYDISHFLGCIIIYLKRFAKPSEDQKIKEGNSMVQEQKEQDATAVPVILLNQSES